MITGNETPEKTSLVEEESSEAVNIEQSEPKDDSSSMENTIKLLTERIQLYQIAEKKAKEENEPGRARRFNRGIKTLKELLNNAQGGKTINEADIPPQLPPSATAELTEKVSESNEEATTGIV